MKILVTGHDGYVGTVLMGMLREAGHEPTGVDTLFFQGCGFGDAGCGNAEKKDIRDLKMEDLVGLDGIVHLAALSNDPLGSLNPDVTFTINRDASVRLATLAKAAGVSRFVFASSCSLYGAAGSELVGEDAPLNPVTPYGESKVQVERALTALGDDSFSPTFLRAATAYGFSPRLRADVVVNDLIGSALSRGEVRLLSDGRSWRPLLHVDDMCRAFVGALGAHRETVHNQAFNLVREGENYLIREVAEMVAAAVPGCPVSFAEGGGPDRRSYRVDGSKLATVLREASPQWGLEEGIRDLVSKLDGLVTEDTVFFGPKFIRLKKLQQLLDEKAIDEELRWTDFQG